MIRKLKANASVLKDQTRPFAQFIGRRLSSVKEVDAIFIAANEERVVHVYSVVRDFHADVYDELLKQEKRIEKKFPEARFDFHLRAHQGREPHLAVPADSRLLFFR